jgi:dimethylargininase
MYRNAIVRRPCENLVRGISRSNLGKPDYTLALKQHDTYIAALRKCGLNVKIIPDNDNFPDSVFIEDIAVCLPSSALITRPGAPTRIGETVEISASLESYFSQLSYIEEPGTVDGGDILKVDRIFYIGISERTNPKGANQVIDFVEKAGFSAIPVKVNQALHLKSAVSYIGNNNILLSGEYIESSVFEKYNCFHVPENEQFAANCLNVNDTVLIPNGCPQTQNWIESKGFNCLALDISEFQKLDGSLTCLSLVF